MVDRITARSVPPLTPSRCVRAAFGLALLLGAARASAGGGATLCVSPGGAHGCAASVQDAIESVTAPHTTIVVEPGTYTAPCEGPACSVAAITGSAENGEALAGLTLRCGNGKHRGPEVLLDATGLDHGVYVADVNGVTIAGCTVEHARREGILVESSRNVHVLNNEVADNDEAMAATVGQGGPPCPTFLAPGTPGTGAIQCCPDAFPTGPGGFPYDNDDCGEGLHLRAVTASVVEGNDVHGNIGGILLTDETGSTSGNLVANNRSEDNVKFGGDCGVTLASHLACAPGSDDATGCTLAAPGANGIFEAHGVSRNAVVGNTLRRNGAAGTGMFANPGIPPGSATKANANLVSDNLVQDNGEPGIAIHVHAANGQADHNVITGNVVSGNGGDEETEAPSPSMGIEVFANKNGPAPGFQPAPPIVGTVVSRNTVYDEDVDVWVGNNHTKAAIFLNDLLGPDAVGVRNTGTATVFATYDWWGCPTGPNTPGCSAAEGDVVTTPWLRHPATAAGARVSGRAR